jgi:YidC/Oxa1 family membrane protein insertase
MLKLYREAGINPLGCLGPQLIQIPIFIALFQVIRRTLGDTPEQILNLSGRLYDVDFIQSAVPLSRSFLWMDLGANGDLVLAFIVFAAMWLQQRISMNRNAAAGDQQRQMNQMMLWMMPVMFAWFVIVTPAGVGLYWAASTLIGLILHWSFVGPGDFTWGSLIPNIARRRIGLPDYQAPEFRHRYYSNRPQRAAVGQEDASEGGDEARKQDESSGDERANGRRSGRQGSQSAGSRTRSGRRRRRHRG